MAPRLLKRAHVEQGLDALSRKHARLKSTIDNLTDSHIASMHGRPVSSAFTSLTRSVCAQQLSTKAARTIFTRFQRLVPAENGSDVCPHAVHATTEDDLRKSGLSTSKVRSVKDLASRFVAGSLSDEVLSAAEDIEQLGALLLDVRGIGPWTVQMFGIFFLKLPDIAVHNDLGVRKGCAKIYGLSRTPTSDGMVTFVDTWKPYRSLGAHLCWKALEF